MFLRMFWSAFKYAFLYGLASWANDKQRGED
jgi:hypothetical protein